MAIAKREVSAVWKGTLTEGSGEVVDSTSSALNSQVMTWASRTEEPNGKTSPEELVAAAHAACYAMQLSGLLTENGTAPEKVEVTSVIVLDEKDGSPAMTEDNLVVHATVPGIDKDKFQELVQQAKEICPVSRLYAGGSAKITVEAELA